MDKKNILIILICFLLAVVLLFVWSSLERKNIIFKKCLDVIPQENLRDISMFKVNVATCKQDN